MSWRLDYRPGKFRGIEFNLETSSATGGRRTVLNEFPLRDEATTEDMGRRARQFSLDMVFIGPDYMKRRDAMLKALEEHGTGTLIHPFRGEFTVAVMGEYRCEERTTSGGGKATISQTFVEDLGKKKPDSETPPDAPVNESASEFELKAMEYFAKVFDALDQASHVLEDAIRAVEEITAKIMAVGGLLDGVERLSKLYAEFMRSLENLILAPKRLAVQLAGLVMSMSYASVPMQAYRAMQDVQSEDDASDDGSLPPPTTPPGTPPGTPPTTPAPTPAQVQKQINRQALNDLVDRVAVSEASRLAIGKVQLFTFNLDGIDTDSGFPVDVPGMPSTAVGQPTDIAGLNILQVQTKPGIEYDNRQQAVTIRDELIAELDRQRASAPSEIYPYLTRLNTDLVRGMNAKSTSLVPLSQYTPVTTLPALLLAHQLYGDARRAEELVERNTIAHPGFVPGGAALEIKRV